MFGIKISRESKPIRTVAAAAMKLDAAKKEYQSCQDDLNKAQEISHANGTFWDRHGGKIKTAGLMLGCLLLGAAAKAGQERITIAPANK